MVCLQLKFTRLQNYNQNITEELTLLWEKFQKNMQAIGNDLALQESSFPCIQM